MKNKKPIIFAALLFVICLTIGGTIAYYTSSDTFDNTFNSGTYDIETQENFVSPDNWTPGTTTPKTVIATNKGTTPAAVRIKLTPSWVDANGDPLPLKDSNDNEAAIINFTQNYDKKWIYQDGYYYYKRALNENQSTTSLLKSVTFNPNFEVDKSQNCETVNGTTTCRTTYNDYSGGTYTLQVEIETCQYDQYQEIWNTSINLYEPTIDGVLMANGYDYSKTFGKEIARNSFESITTVDNKNIPEGVIDSWDVSTTQNGSVMAWYTDTDNDNKYELYIGQEDGVIANPDSSYAFYYFRNAESIDVTNLDTANVTNMNAMFNYSGYNAQTFNIIGLNSFDTSNVTDMGSMFSYAGYNSTNFTINLNNFNTSNVTNIHGIFSNAGYKSTNFEVIGLNGWNTSNVTDMGAVFYQAGHDATTWNIGNINNWDTHNVTTMRLLFSFANYSASSNYNLNLSSWDTSNVENMESTFQSFGRNAGSLELNLSNWDTSKVTTMNSTFVNTGSNSTTFSIVGLDTWNMTNVVEATSMFSGTGSSATIWSIGDLSNWNLASVINAVNMFNSAGLNATTWSIGDLSNWNMQSASSIANMFRCAGQNSTNWVSIGTLKIYNASSINQLFNDCPNAKATINIYGNPTNYNRAFYNASTASGAGITVNYMSTTTNIDNIIATKSSTANVVKGSQLD